MTDTPPKFDDVENAARIAEAFAEGHPDAAELLRNIAQAIRERAFCD